MTLNAQSKGKTGEREVCELLRVELMRCCTENPWIDMKTRDVLFSSIQRNQNQSAVGGHDIEFMGLSIEVKRCETLSMNAWWDQCRRAALRINARPVLLFRQNRKPWRAKMEVMLPVSPGTMAIWSEAELEAVEFEKWLRVYIAAEVKAGRVR